MIKILPSLSGKPTIKEKRKINRPQSGNNNNIVNDKDKKEE